MEAETTARMPKPPVPPQLVRDHYPASARAAKEGGMPKPSMPTQLDRGHNPASVEAATAVLMISIGFQQVWEFIPKRFMEDCHV